MESWTNFVHCVQYAKQNEQIDQIGSKNFKFCSNRDKKSQDLATFRIKKTKFVPPKTRYLNTIKQGYKDCKLSIKSLDAALLPLKHLQR